jgi:hypothetical protein
MTKIIHPVVPYGHCATVCPDGDGHWIAYYKGPECTDRQAVIIEYWENDIKLASRRLPNKTGNCVLVPGETGPTLIFSYFTDTDSKGNKPQMPVERWIYCTNWISKLRFKDRISISTPTLLVTNPKIGYLTRCNPIRVFDEWLLPMYKEFNCHGKILRSHGGEVWQESGVIGSGTLKSHGRFGKGVLIQPTIWFDGERLHSLSRDITPNLKAWYSFSKNKGESWSKPRKTNIWNTNNSLVAINDGTDKPWLIWNEGSGRYQLVLGRWNSKTLSAEPQLQLNRRGTQASYPNYCIDNHGEIHIVFSESGPITRIKTTFEYLEELPKDQFTYANDLPDWQCS